MNKVTKHDIELIVPDCRSIREVLRKLGRVPDGGSKQLRALIKSCNIKHFKGQSWLKGRHYIKKSNNELFILNSNRNSSAIREQLFKRKLKDKVCEKCGLRLWLDKPIPLELHHINGIDHDNRLENLEILCPNCHYFTPTYKIKNYKVSK